MLSKFSWDIPVNATGAQATPSIRIILKPKDIGNVKSAGKYNFIINKAAAADLGLADKYYSTAFSFDIENELIMALSVPATIPHYKMRTITSGGLLLSNKRLAEKIFTHLGHNRLKADENGQIVMAMNFREEKPDGEVRIFNLNRQK